MEITKMSKQELVQNIFRVERSRLRLTAQTVGDMCGVSKQAIADTERLDKTRTSIKTDLYKKLCKIYGLNEDKIYKMIARQRESEKTARKEARKWVKFATMTELQKMPEELKRPAPPPAPPRANKKPVIIDGIFKVTLV